MREMRGKRDETKLEGERGNSTRLGGNGGGMWAAAEGARARMWFVMEGTLVGNGTCVVVCVHVCVLRRQGKPK